MNIFLWILQILVALMFLIHARLMFFPESPQARQMPYMLAIPTPFRCTLGAAEALAAIGLILPGLIGGLPWLTPLAAMGLVILMAGAAVFHIPRREYPNIVLNLILLALAAVVAYGRLAIAPL
ncbi:MAG: DoxX family protein [Anaerolineales bacterium]